MGEKSLLATTLNTRDLGGHITSNGQKTVCGRIIRSDRQEYPDQDDITLLLSKGITTIIDMRGEADIKTKPSGFARQTGFTYINIPIEEGSSVPESVEAVPKSYMKIATSPNIRKVFEMIGNAPAGVMYNCAAGKDRTGVVTAILLMLCGVGEEEIVSDYMLTKECNRERFEMLRVNHPEIDLNIVIPRESYIIDFMKLFKEKFSDADGYFRETGVSDETKNRILKKMMREENEELTIELQDTEWPFEYTDHDRRIARGIVYDDEGYFYFVRAQRDDDFGKATLIETSGGGVEADEDLITAIKRELKEELGAEVSIVCKIGLVSDYYNLIHRHNLNNYFLCKVLSFGEKNLTQDEIESFHLSTLRLSYQDAVKEYKRCSVTKLGRLVANRELPMLKRAKEIIEGL
ncbi:tyrosine-protein phosphatase [Butyrivibrio sp. INlla14]|uniref:tyrosine-protein phosphatase n=1 Tax=Butyrivibrio sp. INlla14 TaxID=1520808 RepID=UPI000876E679|nr:tyrosine-protein phosphatase [Butyrivibrio sp. INlla14]SCY71757.1 Protein tyrosine/serine phosphatase [Butyrivibrio sp. INlla14]